MIKICERTPRDGLQSLRFLVNTDKKIKLIKGLLCCGFKDVEATSFTKHFQFVDSNEVSRELSTIEKSKCSVIVPNMKGLIKAMDNNYKNINIITSVSDKFCIKNMNGQTIDKINKNYKDVVYYAIENGCNVNCYISNTFGCNFEIVSNDNVYKTRDLYLNYGVSKITYADTIGTAHPADVYNFIKKHGTLSECHYGFHFHNNNILNVDVGIEGGIYEYDTCLKINGELLGGCPVYPNPNMVTQDLIDHLQFKHKLNLDVKKLNKLLTNENILSIPHNSREMV